MYPSDFEYHRAGSVDEALELLSAHGGEAKLLAGGHSLLPLMKLRFAQPSHLVDIRRIPELGGIREEGDSVVIGALTTHRELETSALLEEKVRVLAEAAATIGDPLVRNMGTIGGSLAHADPGADLPAVMLALEAEMTAVGPDSSRSIDAGDFFVGMFTSALSEDEILTAVRVPLPPEGTGGAYEKFAHPASRYAVAGVAASLTVSGDGAIARARVGVTGAGASASRAAAVEEALEGAAADAATLEAAAEEADEGLGPQADLQGSADYKRNLVRVVTKRALSRALERAG